MGTFGYGGKGERGLSQEGEAGVKLKTKLFDRDDLGEADR